jgi:hypothetical protein
MMLSNYRFGIAPLRTTAQLQQVLSLPIYLYVAGSVGIVYPTTSPSNPSSVVGLVAIRPLPTWVQGAALPLYLAGIQWASVGVPVLQDPRIPGWRGSLGSQASSPVLAPQLDPTTCTAPLVEVGLQSPTLNPQPGFLYACDPTDNARLLGRSAEYLRLLRGIIGVYAQQAGYGSPLNG